MTSFLLIRVYEKDSTKLILKKQIVIKKHLKLCLQVAIWNLRASLTSLLGPDRLHVLPFYSCLAFYLDDSGLPLPLGPEGEPEQPVSSRVAVILTSADHVSVSHTGDAPRLMGAQAQRRDQLARLGYTLVELPAGKFLATPSETVRLVV